ncbi:uncharacterized protein LOC110452303 [Mizuhopecten yessoensis]|uniref:Ankyrin repeat protein n=1 Tax=Mizuhopecten yessoensis TaxID=6573 RepID=A0A210QJV8_MIZYE|nr:uncharacterized protein LOC110452303 [Mizuhopecten yessoensis]XP_021356408.1 uncharacterized protein LOC110452303 [Mizuhopecten yessoensis]OWF49034.1 Ankyrin repeat protein [Mizuhopecten yessoensis]
MSDENDLPNSTCSSQTGNGVKQEASEDDKTLLEQKENIRDPGHVEVEERIEESSYQPRQREQTEDESLALIYKGNSFNGMRLWFLSTHTCQEIMRDILKNKNPFGRTDENLRDLLNNRKDLFEKKSEQLYQKFLRNEISYENVDTTLMYVIARNVLHEEILPGPSKWDPNPSKSDTSLQASVDRLRQFRNSTAHIAESNMPDDDAFMRQCRDLKTVVESVEKCLGLQPPQYGIKVERVMYAEKPSDVDKLERKVLETVEATGKGVDQQVLTSLDDRLQEIASEFKKFNDNLTGQEAQTKALIENHEVEERFYEETKLSRKAMELLEEHHHLLITGDSGSGKTALAFHLMFQLFKLGHCKVHNLNSISEFLNNIDPNGFVITLVEISETITKKDQKSLKTIIREYIHAKQKTSLYIIMTTGLESVTKIANQTPHIDLSDPEDDTLCLDFNEKMAIIQKQLKRACANTFLPDDKTLESITKMTETPIAFPQAAFLFADNEHYRKYGAEFFRSPVVYYRSEIERCTQRNSNTVILLALLFEENPISFTTQHMKKIKQKFSEDEGGKKILKDKQMKQLPDAAKDLVTEELVSEAESKYGFRNPAVEKAVLSFAVEKFLTLTLQNLNQETLCDTTVFRCTGQHEEIGQLLQETDKSVLACRVFEDMLNDRTAALSSSDAWLDQSFISKLMKTLEKHRSQKHEQNDACINKLMEWSVKYKCLPLCKGIEKFLREFNNTRRIAIMTHFLLHACETMNNSFHLARHEFKLSDLLHFFANNGADCSHCTCTDGKSDHSFPLRWILNSGDDESLRVLLKAGAKDPHSHWGFWNLLAAAAKEEETIMCTCSFVSIQCSSSFSKEQQGIGGDLVEFAKLVKEFVEDSRENKQKLFFCCLDTIGLNPELMRAMHEQEFQILSKDEKGNNCLHYVLSLSPPPAKVYETVSVLANVPDLLTDTNNDSKTPLAMAVQIECDIKRIVKLSEKCPYDILTEALHLCITSKINDETVSQRAAEMIKCGANPHEVVSSGQTCMQAAISRGKSRIKTLGMLSHCQSDSDIHATTFMLHYCIKLDLKDPEKEEAVAVLIKEKASVNQQNDEGVTPLMLAVQATSNNLGLVKLLLNNGAEKNIPDKKGMFPLHYCCMADMETHIAIEIVDILLTDDKIKEMETSPAQSPLMLAIKNRKEPDLVKKLVDANFDVHETDSDGNTVLHLLMHSHFEDKTVLEIVQTCIDNGAAPFAQNDNNETPVVSALSANQGRFETIRNILDTTKFCYKSLKDSHGRSLLHVCIEAAMADENTSILCQSIIQCEEFVTEDDCHEERNTAISLAVSSKNTREKTLCTLLKSFSMEVTHNLFERIKIRNKLTHELLTLFLDYGIQLEDRCKEDMMPFHIKDDFATAVDADIVLPLTKLGFDVNRKTNAGDTLLVSACKSPCNASLIGELATYSNHNLCTLKREAYLPLIVKSDRSDEDTMVCIELIMREAKTAIDQVNEMHRTALIESVRKRKPNTFKYLICNGANQNLRDRYGKTALHYCVESELFDDEVCELLSILLPERPNVKIEDTQNRTVLNLASCHATRSRVRTLTMLLKHPCDVETVDDRGRTPVHNCIEHVKGDTKLQVLERLCRLSLHVFHKADPHCKDDKGKTAIDLCRESHCDSFAAEIEFLTEKNMDKITNVISTVLSSTDSVVVEQASENVTENQPEWQPNSTITDVIQTASEFLHQRSLNDPETRIIGYTQGKKEGNVVIPFEVPASK